MARSLRIANCSGFYGDRLTAAREMVEGGPIDILTGDYLAELTMAILWRNRQKEPSAGYANTFLGQMEEVMGSCLDKGIKVVANAGGLNPAGLARRLEEMAAVLGLSPRVAYVEGDDLIDRLEKLIEAGHSFDHMESGKSLADTGVEPVTANAYLGGHGIATALGLGADIVVTGRVTDAAMVIGPSIWHFGWSRQDWDRLAAALVAGHVIECGAQATGGNYSFFTEVPGLAHVGFPLVEMEEDGSFVVTKHPGSGGMVSVGTVTAQLLYEIGGPAYVNPDVVARFDTIRLQQQGPDRVQVDGIKGAPPPSTLKVALNYFGGYRNTITFVIPGLDVAAKARLIETALWEAVGGREQFGEVDVQLIGGDRIDPANNEEAMSQLRITVKDQDRERVGKRFTRAGVELALAHYPGFALTGAPAEATAYAVYWPTTIPASLVPMRVVMGDEEVEVSSEVPSERSTDFSPQEVRRADVGGSAGEPGAHFSPQEVRRADVGGSAGEPGAHFSPQEVRRADVGGSAGEAGRGAKRTSVPLGAIAGARSGDKGGDANVGVWTRSPAAFDWLLSYLTVDRFKQLIPESAVLDIERFEFPNLSALNFVVHGLLGEGVSSSTRSDPQAKTLGEYLRAKLVEVPEWLL